VFVTDPNQVPADATPFDMRGVELSHHHGDCSFETILRTYELSDPVLWRIAEIVHEADLDDGHYDAPEAPGQDVGSRGLSMTGTDEETLASVTRSSWGSTSSIDEASSWAATPREEQPTMRSNIMPTTTATKRVGVERNGPPLREIRQTRPLQIERRNRLGKHAIRRKQTHFGLSIIE
jgi:hypothetical protein